MHVSFKVIYSSFEFSKTVKDDRIFEKCFWFNASTICQILLFVLKHLLKLEYSWNIRGPSCQGIYVEAKEISQGKVTKGKSKNYFPIHSFEIIEFKVFSLEGSSLLRSIIEFSLNRTIQHF